MSKVNKFIRYFKNPLHWISESTSYRIPNSLIHLPVILLVPYIGIFICGSEAKHLLPVYFIVALYIGRDLVIMSYRNYVIPLSIWGVFVPFLVYKKEVSNLLTLHAQQQSLTITAAVAAVFIVYIVVSVK